MRVDHTSGPLLASLLAGPITASPLLLDLLSPDRMWRGWDLAGLALVLLYSTLIGFTISLLPNLAGSALMRAAGRRYSAARRRRVWAAAGAGGGWLIGGVMIGGLLSGDPAGALGLLFAPVGMVCALISRCFSTWED